MNGHCHRYIWPFLILITLLGLLAIELFHPATTPIQTNMIGENLPKFRLPLFKQAGNLTPDNFKGQVSLLNIWASWCEACRVEMPMLNKINTQYHIPIYAITYKNSPAETQTWLNNFGNPYQAIGQDSQGDAVIDLGVYGTPETFIINAQGKIIYRHIGMITPANWNDILYPIIQKNQEK